MERLFTIPASQKIVMLYTLDVNNFSLWSIMITVAGKYIYSVLVLALHLEAYRRGWTWLSSRNLGMEIRVFEFRVAQQKRRYGNPQQKVYSPPDSCGSLGVLLFSHVSRMVPAHLKRS